jgi:hypothetical protein
MLEGYIARKAVVAGAVNFPPAPNANFFQHSIVTEGLADHRDQLPRLGALHVRLATMASQRSIR